MPRAAPFVLAACCALLPALTAAQTDPLKSAACAEALVRLDAARTTGASEPARQAAARMCLGLQAARAPGAGRWAQPPLVVPPPVIEPSGAPMLSAPKPLPPAVPIERPATITTCDANGCWTAEGARLPRIGPGLLAPGGPCSVQGGLAYCP